MWRACSERIDEYPVASGQWSAGGLPRSFHSEGRLSMAGQDGKTEGPRNPRARAFVSRTCAQSLRTATTSPAITMITQAATHPPASRSRGLPADPCASRLDPSGAAVGVGGLTVAGPGEGDGVAEGSVVGVAVEPALMTTRSPGWTNESSVIPLRLSNCARSRP